LFSGGCELVSCRLRCLRRSCNHKKGRT
jgi:hypothetical protein